MNKIPIAALFTGQVYYQIVAINSRDLACLCFFIENCKLDLINVLVYRLNGLPKRNIVFGYFEVT